MSWPRVALGEIFEIARGGSPRPIDDYVTDDPDGLNWISISDGTESSKYIEKTARRIKRSGLSKTRLVRPGDLLLTNSMSFGRPYIMGTTGCIHDGWLVLSDRSRRTDPDFMYHLLGSSLIYSEFERLAAGATVKNLNIELVSNVKVPLPSLSEQRRIAAILDAADALRTKRQAALAKMHPLAQAAFVELFGNTPKSGSRKLGRLGDFVEFVGGGTPSRSVPEYFQGEICWATAKDVRDEALHETKEHVTEAAINKSATKLVDPGTVLVVVKSKILMKRLPVTIARVPVCFGQDLKGLVPSGRVTSRFVARSLLVGQRWLLEKARGANTEGLTLEHLRSFPIVVPSALELKRHDEMEARVEAHRTQLKASLKKIDSAFASLQRRAFQGRL